MVHCAGTYPQSELQKLPARTQQKHSCNEPSLIIFLHTARGDGINLELTHDGQQGEAILQILPCAHTVLFNPLQAL